MILANLTKAIRQQNYYVVVLEFLIVIAGVVIGFQITAWNEARKERSLLDEKLVSVANEMIENEERLVDYISEVSRDEANMIEFITWMGASDDASDEEGYQYLFNLLPIVHLNLKHEALIQLRTSKGYGELSEPDFIDLLDTWDRLESELTRANRDLLGFRNDYVMPLLVETAPLVNILHVDPNVLATLPDSHFEISASQIRSDRRFENIAANKIGLGSGTLNSARELLQLSQQLRGQAMELAGMDVSAISNSGEAS